VQQKLQELELDGALVSDSDNVFYLSGHLISEGNAPAVLVVPVSSTPVLIVHEDEKALFSVKNFAGDILTYTMGDSPTGLHAASRLFTETYGDSLKRLGIESMGFPIGCASEMGLSSGEDWKDIEGVVARFRRCKDEDEIDRMRDAASIADTGQRTARELFREGWSEIELLSGCRSAMERESGAPMEFLADVLFGEKTALIGSPDGVASDHRAASSDPAIVDLLPRARGYFADTTRTLWVGRATHERQRVVALLRDVKRNLEKFLKPGVQAVEVDGYAREKLNREGNFPHHTGHGIGISHFEAPFIRPGSSDVLEAGMVITLEPGLYFEDWGARIEDDYLITPDGCERLTTSEGG
jgi:Xaa-Pro aminopeptidase